MFRSAYPSKEEARKAQLQSTSAGFAPLISLEEEDSMAAGMDPSIAITQVQGVAHRYSCSPPVQGSHLSSA